MLISIDEEMIRVNEFNCYYRNIGLEDFELDLRRSLQTFSETSEATDDDAPLPAELRRRFMIFQERAFADEQALNLWIKTCREASSMNAAFRESIRKGEA